MAKFSNEIYTSGIDSSDNNLMRDVLGNKNDTHDGNSVKAVLHTLDEHVHKASNCYPSLASGVAVVGGAGAWSMGSFTEIIPTGSITSDFDIHFISVEDLSAVDVYEISLYASETEISRIRVARTANQDSTTQIPVQTPIQPANTQIQAKVASSSGGDTATLSLHYHTY